MLELYQQAEAGWKHFTKFPGQFALGMLI